MENREIDLSWWGALQPQWKDAFAVTFFSHPNEPTPAELSQLYHSPALRFAGPTAPYPNMQFELSDLSGVAALQNLEILVVVHHQIETIQELKNLPRLKNLFLYNNKIRTLNALEEHVQLEQLYIQCNQVDSLQSLVKLTNLRELYVNSNAISSLDGLTEEHAEKLNMFFLQTERCTEAKRYSSCRKGIGNQMLESLTWFCYQ